MREPQNHGDLDFLHEEIFGLSEDVISLDEDMMEAENCIWWLCECVWNLNEALSLAVDLLNEHDAKIKKLKGWTTGSIICIVLLAIAIILNSVWL